ncbi:MAG TPA: RHS repeat-associated core domain-containing protein, partial [Gemmatimonadales bacterium]|nr:RHS repeat-associated core domain-containing protein [Gemmatimonadales bacterium]
LWENRVVGRQPNTGNRRFYHFDHLGSTRAVVDGATIVESYDFEPWGLLMPGRTLAGPTKEGFTSKERDTETGLDYFGARYYMPALGRWAAVDPLAQQTLWWSPYAYANDNPVRFIDPTGRQTQATAFPGVEQGSRLTGADAQELWRQWRDEARRRYLASTTPLQRRGECGAQGHILACMRVGTKAVPELVFRKAGDAAFTGVGGEVVAPWLGRALAWGGTRLKSLGVLFQTGSKAAPAGEQVVAAQGMQVFRVFGDDALALGRPGGPSSWTPVDPATVPGFRAAAGLPTGNSGRFVVEGILEHAEGVIVRESLAGAGGSGGLAEFLVPNAALQIKLVRVSGVNPPF